MSTFLYVVQFFSAYISSSVDQNQFIPIIMQAHQLQFRVYSDRVPIHCKPTQLQAKHIDKTTITCIDDVISASEKNKRKANALASVSAKKQVKKALFPQK
jgi:hypothetical protein